MQVSKEACQCTYENLRSASSAMPMAMLHRRLVRFKNLIVRTIRYFKNHGLVRTVERALCGPQSAAANRREADLAEGDAEDSMRKALGGRTTEQALPRGHILRLQPGELVEVKLEKEIEETLDHRGSSKGLLFLPEMRDYCGKRFKVYKRLERMMIESTGEIRRVKNTVLLEGAMCDGSRHHGCGRSCFFFWREAWLRRVEKGQF